MKASLAGALNAAMAAASGTHGAAPYGAAGGAPPQQWGGAPPGHPPPQPGWGGAPPGYPPLQQPGWGTAPPGYPPAQQQPGWGAPAQQPQGYPPAQQAAWGAPPPQQGYGAPPSSRATRHRRRRSSPSTRRPAPRRAWSVRAPRRSRPARGPRAPARPASRAPRAAAAAAVVSPHFAAPVQTTLVLAEQFGTFRNDNFNITDAAGRHVFTLAAAAFSVGGKRQLLDAGGAPLLCIERKLLSLHGTWVLTRPGDGARLAEVKPSLASLTPSVKVYLNDGDSEPDFVIKGDFRGKRFTIAHRQPGRGEAVVASVARESRFASTTALLMSMVTDANRYFVTIEPGVDGAFIAALATLCDEIFNDREGA
ncbi:LURP-related protein [Scenedesmus sp. PABB004]|nr:LURP-related protein [Scenedesmus sp. PABB004]